MAESTHFYKSFLSAIRFKITNKATLVNAITDLLAIDKDAVYRRLRGEVNFSFSEMAIIARSMGISLDSIAGIENFQSKPAKLNISKQVNPEEMDYEMFEGHVDLLKSIMHESDTVIMEAGNILPHYLYSEYEYLSRFYQFIWNRSSGYGPSLPFHEIVVPQRLRNLQVETCRYARHIKSTQYVWDSMIFQRLVTDIKFYVKIDFIKEEDVYKIKQDLMSFLENIENLTIKGKFEDTGNEISIYIVDTNCDTNYSCLTSNNIQMTLFKVFLLNAIVCLDESIYDEALAWIRSLQRMSTLISVSGEKARATFFSTQRNIINTI